MGRGRQKAKQTKVARELKYYSPGTDYRALEQELTSLSHNDSVHRGNTALDTDEDDAGRWGRWSDDEDDQR